MNKLIGAALIVAFLCGSTVFVLAYQPPPASAVVKTNQSAPESASNKPLIEVQARVVPVNSVELRFPSTGGDDSLVVQEVLVHEGDAVQPGAVLARVDTRAMQLRVAAAEAALGQARAEYDELHAKADAETLEADAEMANLKADAEAAKLRAAADASQVRANAAAERVLGRAQAATVLEASVGQLLQAAAVLEANAQANQEKLAAARSAVDKANVARIARAAAGVQQAQALLDQAQHELEQATLLAPVAGTVAAVNIKVGEGSRSSLPAIVLADLSSWQFATEDVTDVSVVRINPGDVATIGFPAIPGLTLHGKVSSIKPLGEMKESSNALYSVIITSDQSDKRLRWNMAATVSISSAQ